MYMYVPVHGTLYMFAQSFHAKLHEGLKQCTRPCIIFREVWPPMQKRQKSIQEGSILCQSISNQLFSMFSGMVAKQWLNTNRVCTLLALSWLKSLQLGCCAPAPSCLSTGISWLFSEGILWPTNVLLYLPQFREPYGMVNSWNCLESCFYKNGQK